MAGDRGARTPRAGSGAHVWELPDCGLTLRDARGQSRLLQTASDDVTRAVGVLSAPTRPSTSVTERGAGPRSGFIGPERGYCWGSGWVVRAPGGFRSLPSRPAWPSVSLRHPRALSSLASSQILDSAVSRERENASRISGRC